MEQPHIGPYRAAIRERLERALKLPAGRVNVKASTGEGIGFVGRGEGVAALAIASVEQAS
jgi:2-C-methyl-D-erythritol 2,4-cyclodiphosphate synthase